jgi:diaminopimelate decarboxylase
VIRESANLPLLNMGDHVVIHNVGAYNMTQWMQFITLRPNVVLIDLDEKPHLIRIKESLENMNSMERVPSHLTFDR